MTRYDKVMLWLKDNLLITIALVAFIAITGTATLIKSVKEIRIGLIGDPINILVYNPSEIEISKELTPEVVTRKYILDKPLPYQIPKESITWKAYIFENQPRGEKVRVISDDTVIDLFIADYKVLKLLQSLKPGTFIVFTGKIEDQPGDLDLDIKVNKVYLNI